MNASKLLRTMTVGFTLGLLGCGGGAAPQGAQTPAGAGNRTAPSKNLGGKPATIPAEWEEWRDEGKKYGFRLPKGTTTDQRSGNGIDFLMATLPAPYRVKALAIAMGGKAYAKDDLVGAAKLFLADPLGATEIAESGCEELDAVFRACFIQFVNAKGDKQQGGLLVGSDGKHSHILIAASPEADLADNAATIDALLGSYFLFE